MRAKIAYWVMDNRFLVTCLFILVTLLFSLGLPKVDIRTVFNDLLPLDDPFVQIYYDNKNFGNPMTMAIMVKNKNGDIYNPDTLAKVWDITRDIDLAPAVDHDQILSVATEKIRYATATVDGIDTKPLMDDHPPETVAEIAEFKRRVLLSPSAQTFFVSRDETAALITAAFLDHVDYGEAFDYAQNLVLNARDGNHEVHLTGHPVLTGWVYKLQKQTYGIFAITLLLLVIALVFYMKNIAGVVTPVTCAAVAGVWGFGFIGLLGKPIEPLLMIVPLLLVARSFSHCVQYTERYYEILSHVKDRKEAAEHTMNIMMAPSILGILTDVCGIIFIAIAPIKAMDNHAIFCGMWALWIIPTGTFLCSILLSYLPVPKNMQQMLVSNESKNGLHASQGRLLKRLATLSVGTKAKRTSVLVIIIGIAGIYLNTQIKIGNPVEGSNILWPDSEFNIGVRAINAHFPGTNTLEIVLESKTRDITHRVANTPKVVEVAQALQRKLEMDEVLPPRASLTFADYMSDINRLFSGGNPKWAPLDLTDEAISAAGFAALLGSNAVNFGHVADFEFQNSTVSFWYKDNKQETVDHALAAAAKAVEEVGLEHPDFHVKLGTGVIALQQAMNNVISRYHWIIIGMVNVAVMILAGFAYRSIVAAFILLIPVNLANLLLVACMHLVGVGLDMNAGIVAVIGVGVGIDYGIYLLSRICEEYSAKNHDLTKAIEAALTTTGKAIMFTATIMLLGITPWYFLSDLKFMADMGLLLILVMLINMLLSLVVLPLLVWYIKPKFLARQDLIIGESIDIEKLRRVTN
ncbi:MAG: efflux RND transporter permease subunit [Gammaproteobacteria bacterium]|jgi:predicted RND superfamily exporter protein|tara:strand:- start:1984 stop:4392 length:2409 start_codon:yes stop_codon:yes gene_type:complete